MEGAIHSIESMGLVDGPGVRGIIFLRGCKLRCQYCHNPDTWHGEGDLTEVAGLVRRMVRLKPYFMSSGGGITISGGEPLLQPAFLTELLRRLKAEGMHTCIDTAGVGLGNYDSILENTDLVLYDVKHWNPAGYLAITGLEMDECLRFEEALRRSGTPIWVRHVVVPGVTDSEAHMAGLRHYVDGLPNVQRVELLPYHTMGLEKYTGLGLPCPLEGTPSMCKERCKELAETYFDVYNRKDV